MRGGVHVLVYEVDKLSTRYARYQKLLTHTIWFGEAAIATIINLTIRLTTIPNKLRRICVDIVLGPCMWFHP